MARKKRTKEPVFAIGGDSFGWLVSGKKKKKVKIVNTKDMFKGLI